MVIDKNDMFFTRGQDGVLIAREVTLNEIEGKPTVKIRPLTRGKLQEIQVMASSDDPVKVAQSDKELLIHGLVEPECSEKELEDMKPQFMLGIATAVLAASLGISEAAVKEQTNDALIAQEEEGLKN